MKRGDIYLVRKPSAQDPRRRRAFIVVSRQVLIESNYGTVICVPVYTSDSGLATQVEVGPSHGLKHQSSIHCDGLVSLQKSVLTDYVGALDEVTMNEMDSALRIALSIED